MKKIFVLSIVLLLAFSCALPAFAAENSVPFIGGGALTPSKNAAPLSDAERQLRETAYAEILTLSQTDKNIIAVKLSEDSRWVFLNVSEDPKTQKKYAKMFDRYSEFLILTGDIEAAESNISNYDKGGQPTGPKIPGGPNYYLWIIIISGIVFGSAFAFAMKRKLIPALQTTNGKVVTRNAAVSKKEAIFSVKQNEQAPDAKVFDSILQKIEKEDK